MAPIQSPWLKVGSLLSGPTQFLLSSTYILLASDSCLRPLTHAICCARALADASAGNNIAARMAIIAMTTSSSIRVNPIRPARDPAGNNRANLVVKQFRRSLPRLLRQDIKLLNITRIDDVSGKVQIAAAVK